MDLLATPQTNYAVLGNLCIHEQVCLLLLLNISYYRRNVYFLYRFILVLLVNVVIVEVINFSEVMNFMYEIKF